LGYKIYEKVKDSVPIKVIGFNPENPPLNHSINDTNELVKVMTNYQVYLNFTQLSPLPMSLLEAAMCGMPIVTTPNQDIPKVFTDGETALFAKTADDFIEKTKFLLGNKQERDRLGSNARSMAIERFHIDRFVCQWKDVFNI
jgi:glycosyltransferase involved in cell wall biosynthesis